MKNRGTEDQGTAIKWFPKVGELANLSLQRRDRNIPAYPLME